MGGLIVQATRPNLDPTVMELQKHIVIDVLLVQVDTYAMLSPVLYNAVHVYLFRVTKSVEAIIWSKKDSSEQFYSTKKLKP